MIFKSEKRGLESTLENETTDDHLLRFRDERASTEMSQEMRISKLTSRCSDHSLIKQGSTESGEKKPRERRYSWHTSNLKQ